MNYKAEFQVLLFVVCISRANARRRSITWRPGIARQLHDKKFGAGGRQASRKDLIINFDYLA
jgi:hypothetical protein